MNIGIDIDGTITDMPEFFSFLSSALMAGGHNVYVVSYRLEEDRAATERELGVYGIEYTGLCLCDMPGEKIPEFKARIAEKLDLDMLFDDMPEALCVLPEKCKRFWLCNPSVYDLFKVRDAMVLNFGS